jgi:KDO2-lipid IV(A) lauroyltransferase
VYLILHKILARLPQKLTHGLLNFFLKRVFKYRYAVIQNNLKAVFYTKGMEEISVLVNEYYNNLARYISEIIRYPEKNLVKNGFIHFENGHLLEDYNPDKKHLIILTGHIGNWELIIPSLPLITTTKVYGVYKPLSNKSLDKYILKFRGKFGLVLTPMHKVVRYISNSSQRKAYVFINDQSPPLTSEGSIIEFLGQPTKWYNGIEKINKYYDCAFLYMHCYPKNFGYTIKFEPLDSNIPLIDYINKLEIDIRKYPSFWLWSHKRWK